MLAKLGVSFMLVFSTLFPKFLYAQETMACIEITEKTTACDHFIIKIADPRIVRSSKIDTPSVCICVSDFQSLFNLDTTSAIPQATVDEQKVLDQWQLSLSELNQLLRY